MTKRHRHAFTLVELIVVITIIVLLAGLVLPMILKAHKSAARARDAADLNALAVALEAYKGDCGDYPRPDPQDLNAYRGAVLLCRAILSPAPATVIGNPEAGDGFESFGFKAIRMPGLDGALYTADDQFSGKTFGPYVQPDKFKVGFLSAAKSWTQCVILDRNKQPILYYVASAGSRNITLANAYVANVVPPAATSTTTFNYFDNSDPATTPALFTDLNKFKVMIGDSDLDGAIKGTERAIGGPFILWATGPDEVFGPKDDVVPLSAPDRESVARDCDDVTFPVR